MADRGKVPPGSAYSPYNPHHHSPQGSGGRYGGYPTGRPGLLGAGGLATPFSPPLLAPQHGAPWLQPLFQGGPMAAGPGAQYHGTDPRTLVHLNMVQVHGQAVPQQQAAMPEWYQSLHPSRPQDPRLAMSGQPYGQGRPPQHTMTVPQQFHQVVPTRLMSPPSYHFLNHAHATPTADPETFPSPHQHRMLPQAQPSAMRSTLLPYMGIPGGGQEGTSEGQRSWPLGVPPQSLGVSGRVRERQVEEVDPFVADWMKIVASKRRKSSEVASMKLPEARNLLARASHLLKSLKHAHHRLTALDPSDEQLWGEITEEVDQNKEELRSIRSQFEDEELVQRLADRVDKCKAKRARLRRQREVKKRERRECKSKAEAATTRLLEKKRKEELKAKTERSVQADASGLLGEVKRKQTDVQTFLKLASNLKELRDLRREASKKSGDAPPIEADERFIETHDSLVHLLTNQKAVYDEEDHALRVLMEEEVAEKMATSVRTRIQGSVTHAAMVHGAGDESLTPHSPFTPHSPLDPLQPFRDYYLLPQRDAKALIAVRTDWDSFISPEGTAVPDGGVEAPAPSDGVWSQYCTDTS